MKYLYPKKIRLIISTIVVITSCTAPTQQAIPTVTSTPSPTPTLKPTNTIVPTATGIPGFEDWSVFNPQAVTISTENDSLILTLRHRSLWFMTQRGVLVYKPVSGNFKITAEVRAAKNSNPSQTPGGDGTVQLGGLMARNGNGGQENYVFVVIGDDGNGLSIETKNTVDSFSNYAGPSWDASEAELRLCRFGSAFKLYKRHLGANEAWIPADSFDRPDLPDTLQVGANIYTDNTPDLSVRFDHLRIESITSEADCEQD
ncbi:MAG TPA: hypothetical protein VFC02_05380 [Anaerolineales bacterium]|nr:hypothetical protein [Anaerolineales bacterium]